MLLHQKTNFIFYFLKNVVESPAETCPLFQAQRNNKIYWITEQLKQTPSRLHEELDVSPGLEIDWSL